VANCGAIVARLVEPGLVLQEVCGERVLISWLRAPGEITISWNDDFPARRRERADILASAMVTIPLTPVDAVRITILMDNVTDPLLFPTEHVERTTWFHHLAKPRAASALTDDGLPDALIAQPGFSALVRVTTGGRERAKRLRACARHDPLPKAVVGMPDRHRYGHSPDTAPRRIPESPRGATLGRPCGIVMSGFALPVG
jgi:hypothetical protein